MAGYPPDRRESDPYREPRTHWTKNIDGMAMPGHPYTSVQIRSTLMENKDGRTYVVGDPGAHVTWSGQAAGTWKHDTHPDPATDLLDSGTGGGQGFEKGQYLVPHSLILSNIDNRNPENSTSRVVPLHHGDEIPAAQNRVFNRGRNKK